MLWNMHILAVQLLCLHMILNDDCLIVDFVLYTDVQCYMYMYMYIIVADD